MPKADVVLGDARLTVAKEKDESFDYLLIDAFSSDAVPTHLMTKEAIAMYAAKLKPDGLGVLHISNRYLDLEAVLQATFPEVPGLAVVAVEDRVPSNGYSVMRSTAVVFSKNPQNAMRLLGPRGGRTLYYRNLAPWTDDRTDVLWPLISRYQNPG
jgi:spermidine synthase